MTDDTKNESVDFLGLPWVMPPRSLKSQIEMAKDWGAYWCKRGKPITENPFADMPGSYVLHAAWDFGWNNSEAILAADMERAGRAQAEREMPIFFPEVFARSEHRNTDKE